MERRRSPCRSGDADTLLIPGNYHFPGVLGGDGTDSVWREKRANADAELITLSTHKWINAHVKIDPIRVHPPRFARLRSALPSLLERVG